MFSSPAWAQDAAAMPPQPGLLESMLPLVLILLVFWFLILRPQSKKMKEHRERINAVRRGDVVVTAGGIVGKVIKIKDDNAELELEIAEGVTVKSGEIYACGCAG